MFRGTAARTVLALLGVTLLALQLFTPTGTFASAHTFGHALAKADAGITSAPVARDGADSVRAPGRPGEPVSVPHLRDRHRGPASHGTQEHALISGRTAGAAPSEPVGAAPGSTPGVSRTRTPAALQVFRC
ncbi:hypothetical protein ACF073_05935 [Streptomyces sp. NPDC015171]|uniref:hypothetical protein n=1 Tax=Streptomyces sp. NPDC015171 TaxID=3364945 RepID=UPI0036FC6F95